MATLIDSFLEVKKAFMERGGINKENEIAFEAALQSQGFELECNYATREMYALTPDQKASYQEAVDNYDGGPRPKLSDFGKLVSEIAAENGITL